MNIKKMILPAAAAGVFCLAVFAGMSGAMAADNSETGGDVRIVLDCRLSGNAEYAVFNDRNGVSVRAFFEKLGAEMSWDAETKTAAVRYGENIFYFNGEDSDIIMMDDKMYVSVDGLSQRLNADISTALDTESQTVELTVSDKSERDFAFRLNELMPDDQNYMFSPYSIKCAMAMAANGADDETAAEIAAVLGIGDIGTYNYNVKQYIENSKYESYDDGIETIMYGTQLNIANAVWINSDYAAGGDFSNEYKSIIEDYYKGTAESVSSADAVQKINAWCAENTNDKIKQIINSGDFSACLTNAVYFSGKWKNTFDVNMTKPDTFTNRNGSEKQIDFMNQTDKFDYYEGDGIKMIAMPYDSGNVSMYVALSDDDSVDFEKYIDSMTHEKVNVSMPKFKTEYDVNVLNLLNSMGISLAFDSTQPHFEKMFNSAVNSAGQNICISDVLHKAYIDVDEEGTEAAAATAIVMAGLAYDPEPEKIYDFKADRPFTYFIRDNSTGDILFVGEYAFAD